MAEGGQDERTCISTIAKSQKKYGSTSNNMPKNEYIVKHPVTPGDTLQGIALRYGVTTEQIRRVNKIWANDSLFLKEYLDIPLPRQSFDSFHLDSDSASPVLSPCRTFTSNTSPSTGDSDSLFNHSRDNSLLKDGSVEVFDREQSIEDILIRIDSSIAKTRSNVKRLEEHRDKCEDEESYPHSNNGMSRASSDPTVSPLPVVMTKCKKVRSSLQRLEKQQDEMFEL